MTWDIISTQEQIQMWAFVSDLRIDQTQYLCRVKPLADCVNTGCRLFQKNWWHGKTNSNCHRKRRENEAWINTSSLSLCITYPPTYFTVEHTHLLSISLTQTHSIPIPVAGLTSVQDYQISSWIFGFPDRACVWWGAKWSTWLLLV